MASAEPVKYVSVPLPRSIWQQLRFRAAVEGRPMSALCAEWIRSGLSALDAERLSAADKAA